MNSFFCGAFIKLSFVDFVLVINTSWKGRSDDFGLHTDAMTVHWEQRLILARVLVLTMEAHISRLSWFY